MIPFGEQGDDKQRCSLTPMGFPWQGVEKQESGRQARRAAMRQAQHIQAV